MACPYTTYKRRYMRMTVAEVRSAIRRDWMRFPRKFAAIQQRAERVVLADGREKTFIRCAQCAGLFTRSQIEANHITPVGPLRSISPEDVEDYLTRMFCKTAEIEPLCKPCHRQKTNAQRKSKDTA